MTASRYDHAWLQVVALALAATTIGCRSNDADHREGRRAARDATTSADARAAVAPDASSPALTGSLVIARLPPRPKVDPNSDDPPPPPPEDTDPAGFADLEVMDLATHEIVPLAKIPGFSSGQVLGKGAVEIRHPGHNVIVHHDHDNGTWQVTDVAPTGSLEPEILSPDGKRRAYICFDTPSQPDLCTSTSDGDTPPTHVPIRPGNGSRISPRVWLDDGRIAVDLHGDRSEELALLDPASGEMSSPTKLPVSTNGVVESLAVSGGGQAAWIVVDKRQVTLNVTELAQPSDVRNYDLGDGQARGRCIFADEKWLACILHKEENTVLVSISLSDGVVHQLDDVASDELVCSPDGKWIIYTRLSSSGEQVRITSIDNSTSSPLLPNGDDLQVLAWLDGEN